MTAETVTIRSSVFWVCHPLGSRILAPFVSVTVRLAHPATVLHCPPAKKLGNKRRIR